MRMKDMITQHEFNSVGGLRNSPRLCYKYRVATRKENLQFDVEIKGLREC